MIVKYYFIILAVIGLILTGCTKGMEDRDIEISDSSFSVGAAFPEQDGTNNLKLTYNLVMQNPDRISIVDNVDVILTKMIKDKVINIQSERLQYDDRGTITISGEVLFDARGLSKEEIAQFDFVKGVQFIGDNNKEYFLPILRQ